MKAVVVLSGGQDSATALAMAVKKYTAAEVAAITFRYGQKHEKEVTYAKGLARHFRIREHKIVSLSFYKHLTSNALMTKGMKIERKKGSKCPTTVVEGRNGIFLMLASVWGKGLGAREVWTGVSEADYSGYPDCRAAFIRSEERTIRLALDYPIHIVTPFIHKTKAEEWRKAEELGIIDLIREKTLTCYNGVPGDGCGKCPACKLRNRGYKEFMKAKG